LTAVDPACSIPRSTWADGADYDRQALKLVGMFAANFGQYLPFIDEGCPGGRRLAEGSVHMWTACIRYEINACRIAFRFR